MTAAAEWLNNYNAYKEKRKDARKNAAHWIQPFIWAGVFFISCTGSFMVYVAFPWVTPIGVASLIGMGFVVDLLVYLPSATKSAKTFFGSGMYADLDDALRIQAVEDFLNTKNLKELSKDKAAQALLKEMIIKYCKQHDLQTGELTKEHRHKIEHLFRKKLATVIARKHKFYRENLADCTDEFFALLKEYDAVYGGDATFKKKYATKWGVNKSTWLTVAFIGAFANGLAFFAIIAAENLEFFAIASLATPAGGGVLVAAAIVGLLQGMLFYNTLKNTIVKGFWDKLVGTLIFKHVKENNSTWSTLASTPKNVLKWLLVSAIVPLSLLSLCLTQSTILSSSMTLISMTTDLVSQWNLVVEGQAFANAAIQIMMYTVLLPFSCIFAVKHVVGACDKLTNAISTGFDWLANASTADLFVRPDKALFYGLTYTVVTLFLIAHTSTEAMMEAGQGVFKPSKIVGPIGTIITSFVNVCNFLGISASKAAAATQMAHETAEHGDFVWKNANWLIKSVMEATSTPNIYTTLDQDAEKIVNNEAGFKEYFPKTACVA